MYFLTWNNRFIFMDVMKNDQKFAFFRRKAKKCAKKYIESLFNSMKIPVFAVFHWTMNEN